MEEEESREEVELVRTANEILAVVATGKTLAYGFHSMLDLFEAHLDGIIKRYKVITMTILLATGAAIGFAFSSELKDLPISKLVMSASIALLGLVAVSSIWYVDIHVYHRFWGAFFVEKVKMEKKYPFLVDIGDASVSLDTIRAQLVGENNFYMFLNFILVSVTTISLVFLPSSYFVKGGIWVCSAMLFWAVFKYMTASTERLHDNLLKLLE